MLRNHKTQDNRQDQNATNASKKWKSSATINAFLIGFLVGIVLYSLVKNTWGLLTLIPLYMIYRLIQEPSKKDNSKSGD